MESLPPANPSSGAGGVLVPLDGSAFADRALPFAIGLATRLEMPLASVIVLRGAYSDTEVAEDEARTRVSSALSDWGAPKTSSIDVLTGDPAEEILWLSQARNCRLIVMATHARSGLMRGLLGSVTDRVIRSSRLPVLVIRPEGQPAEASVEQTVGITTIIQGLDGSDLAEKALYGIVPIALALGARLRLVQVLSLRVGESLGLDRPTESEYDAASRYLQIVKGTVENRGVVADYIVAEGHIDEVLVKMGDETPGSIIALGTRGLSGLKRWTVGSVTDKITRTSSRPVLVVPPKLEADKSAWTLTRSRPV